MMKGEAREIRRKGGGGDGDEIKMEWEERRDGCYQGGNGNDSRDDYLHKLWRAERGEKVRKG